jgi:hypothetical protein
LCEVYKASFTVIDPAVLSKRQRAGPPPIGQVSSLYETEDRLFYTAVCLCFSPLGKTTDEYVLLEPECTPDKS